MQPGDSTVWVLIKRSRRDNFKGCVYDYQFNATCLYCSWSHKFDVCDRLIVEGRMAWLFTNHVQVTRSTAPQHIMRGRLLPSACSSVSGKLALLAFDATTIIHGKAEWNFPPSTSIFNSTSPGLSQDAYTFLYYSLRKSFSGLEELAYKR
jgi:hypothetical protein